MAIKRAKRLDLSMYDTNWKDSYIDIQVKGFKEVQLMQKGLAKLIPKEDVSDNEKIDSNEATMDYMLKQIQHSFMDGKIFDYDTKELRDLNKEEISEFDLEIITALFRLLTGDVEKKG